MTTRLADLADARVAIWGFGKEGHAALLALRHCFPDKPLTLFCSEAEAATGKHNEPDRLAARASSEGNLTIVTGAPDLEALRRFDIVIKSPGISPYKLPAAAALRAGVQFTSGSALWFAEHPHARTICVTGTKGKSTVTALIAHILRKSGKCVALAGNIGLPLLELVEPAREPDWWVIELSSFQTHDFGGAPTVAVVNNLAEEHLDWHGTRERYAADKLAIGAHAQRLVVNAEQSLLLATQIHPARTTFGTPTGWHVAEGKIRRDVEDVLLLATIPLPGLHNAQNVCAALAAIDAAGFDASALAAHVETFKPLPHRLQTLGRRDAIDYINDSIATTPFATIEALRSLGGRQVAVLVGGYDRGLDWRLFVDYVDQQPPAAIVTMGANGTAIASALRTITRPRFVLAESATLADAMAQAKMLLPSGGTVLLSPGAPSFDQFHDYAERGREFARLAGFDAAKIEQIEGLGIA